MRFTLVLTLAASSICAQERFVHPVDTSRVAVHRDNRYRTDLQFDVYRPSSDAIVPVVIFINRLSADFRTWPGYVSWAQFVAANGFAGVVYRSTEEDAAGNFDALIAALRSHAAELHIDPNRVVVWSASTNVQLGLPLAMDRKRDYIRSAVVYYGPGPVQDIRTDLPVFVVRAGLDSPGLNANLDPLIARAIAANAPWTIENDGAGAHAFDLFNDNDVSREIIDRTLAFMRSSLRLSSVYAQLAGAATVGAAFNRGEWDVAIAGYRRLLAADSNDAEAHRRLGIALLQEKQFRESLTELERAYELGRRGPRDTAFPAAQAAAGAGNVERTIYWLDIVLKTPFGPPLDEIRTGPAFAAVRDAPAFQEFLKRFP